MATSCGQMTMALASQDLKYHLCLLSQALGVFWKVPEYLLRSLIIMFSPLLAVLKWIRADVNVIEYPIFKEVTVIIAVIIRCFCREINC